MEVRREDFYFDVWNVVYQYILLSTHNSGLREGRRDASTVHAKLAQSPAELDIKAPDACRA